MFIILFHFFLCHYFYLIVLIRFDFLVYGLCRVILSQSHVTLKPILQGPYNIENSYSMCNLNLRQRKLLMTS